MLEEEIIFKQTLLKTQFKGDTNIIDLHIKHILEFDEGRVKSNIGGYQSNDITFGFQELITFVFECFKEYNSNVILDNFWLNINKGTHFNKAHIHASNTWSVVYYHRVCCEKAALYFETLTPTLNNEPKQFFPKNQEIYFFDGLLPHGTVPCEQESHERISIAFNFVKK